MVGSELTATAALHGRFLRGLARSPDGIAVTAPDGQLTYRELHRLALTWAGSLLAAEPFRAVGVLAQKDSQSYAALLAGFYTGLPVVPLQPAFPAFRTRQMIESAGVDVLVACPGTRAALTALRKEGCDLPALVPGGPAPTDGTVPVDERAALERPRAVTAEDVAYVLFTSGSTGRPKGVPVTHGNAQHYFGLLDRRYDFGPDDVFSQTFDLNFDCAMFDLFCAWGAGARLVAIPPDAYRDLAARITAAGVTVWFSTPSAIALSRRLGGLAHSSLPGLRWSFFAGEALRCTDAACWASAAPGSVVENLYGPTELTITVTAHRWDGARSDAIAVNGVVPIGTVNDGHRHLLLGPDGEENAEEGELCIAGPQLTAGYLDPADDAGRFLLRDDDRFYRTGDRVRRAAGGELLYLGRSDNQVQLRGVRVELAEIDAAVQQCHGVDEAVTVTVTEAGTTELVVWYTGDAAPPAQLFRQLGRVLPAAVVPKRFQHLSEFPLNSNRKIDRLRLSDWARKKEEPA